MKQVPLLLLVGLTVLSLISGCDRGGGIIQHGNLSYDATDLFGAGTSTLMLAKAAGHGDVKEVNRLIAAGADVNAIGKHDITPLWWALWARNITGFQALLDKGANPNAKRSERYSIMYLAADMEDSKFLAAALKHGGNPDLLDAQSGWPPLYPAILHGYEENIDLLLAAKADVNFQDSISGQTLPMLAIGTSNDYKLVYKLI